MSVDIKLKHSSEAGKVPSTLQPGELALNTADVKAYMLDDGGNVVTLVGNDSPVDTRYVEKAGDNMTGDLTLGTDKITLDATDGTITADGQVSANGGLEAYVPTNNLLSYSQRWFDNKYGTRSIVATMGMGGSFWAKQSVSVGTDVNDVKVTLSSNGSITASGDIKIGGTLPAAPNISLDNDGSITSTSTFQVRKGSRLFTEIKDESSIGARPLKLTVAFDSGVENFQPTYALQVYDFATGKDTVVINADGSATYAGDLKLGDPTAGNAGIKLFAGGGFNLFSDGDVDPNYYLTNYVNKNSDSVFRVSSDGTVAAAGSITAAGDVKIGGTLPSSPNIELFASGFGSFKRTDTLNSNTDFQVGIAASSGSFEFADAWGLSLKADGAASNFGSFISYDGEAFFSNKLGLGGGTAGNVNIELDGIDGDITTVGDIQSGGNPSSSARDIGCRFRSSGVIQVSREHSKQAIEIFKPNLDAAQFTVDSNGNINAAGTGTFSNDLRVQDGGHVRVRFTDDAASDAVRLEPDGDVYAARDVIIGGTASAPNIELNGSDGSATFGNTVAVGTSTNRLEGGRWGVETYATNNENGYALYYSNVHNTSAPPYFLRCNVAGSDTIEVRSDGSITTAGTVEAQAVLTADGDSNWANYTLFEGTQEDRILNISVSVFSVKGNGSITAAGDITCSDNSKGLILKSPDGTSFRLSVANDGTLSASAV